MKLARLWLPFVIALTAIVAVLGAHRKGRDTSSSDRPRNAGRDLEQRSAADTVGTNRKDPSIERKDPIANQDAQVLSENYKLRNKEAAIREAYAVIQRLLHGEPFLSWEEFIELVTGVTLHEDLARGPRWSVTLDQNRRPSMPQGLEFRALNASVVQGRWGDLPRVPLEEMGHSRDAWSKLDDATRNALASPHSKIAEEDALRVAWECLEALFPDIRQRTYEPRIVFNTPDYTDRISYSGIWTEKPVASNGEYLAYPNTIYIQIDPVIGKPTSVSADYRARMPVTRKPLISEAEALRLAQAVVQPIIDRGDARLFEPHRQYITWGENDGQATFSYVIDFPMERLRGPRIGYLIRVSVDPYTGKASVSK